MWEPEPGWLAMPGGSGASTVGVWRAAYGDHPVVIKRLAAPRHGDPAERAGLLANMQAHAPAPAFAAALDTVRPHLDQNEWAKLERSLGLLVNA